VVDRARRKNTGVLSLSCVVQFVEVGITGKKVAPPGKNALFIVPDNDKGQWWLLGILCTRWLSEVL